VRNYDSPILVRGRFLIIERLRTKSINASSSIGRLNVSEILRRRPHWSIAVASLTSLAVCATPSQASELSLLAQYHSPRQQYHGRPPASGRLPAPKRELAELNLLISPILISRLSYSDFTMQTSIGSRRSDRGSASRIDRPTARQIERSNHDARLMLRIGAVLALIYLVFLVSWFWATRFLVRPQRSART
jgi:hypothetical protein